MKRILFIVTILALSFGYASAQKKAKRQADEATMSWNYEIEQVATGKKGSVIVKIWTISSKPEVAADQAKKNAVHGIIFKGVPEKDRLPSKRPLMKDVNGYEENKAFFDEFLSNGGAYMRFVTLTTNGVLDAGDLLKITKKEYKVGVQVTVNYDELRKYLEQSGVIKKLDSGF
ncbi:hypothetical protein [Bacteroides sp. 51]|uniref:hypothetical protein n=1 Tax=Bacteroides sp. 51 TaxID=2302938 RepID=UPI0013D59211|nr:hypothetical protein [Bacteroides sp. 51]NDV80446.1 hypothetical protein [Bacteroides sp. 51]